MVESAFRILAVLAALNRVYFSAFQLKRMGKLVSRFELAPPRLDERIEALFGDDAIAEPESLLRDVQALLKAHMPDYDASSAWHRKGPRFRAGHPRRALELPGVRRAEERGSRAPLLRRSSSQS